MSKRTILQIAGLVFLVSSFANPPCARADRFQHALQLIREGRDAFRVTSRADVASAKAQAKVKMVALGEILNSSTAHGEAWKTFLLWDRLESILSDTATADNDTTDDNAADNNIAEEADELDELLDRFNSDYAGMELPAILQLRAALRQYYYRVLAVGNDALPDEFLERLGQLETQVASLQSDPDSAVLQRIGVQLAWLRQQEQVPEVVQAVRGLAPAANMRFLVSDRFISGATREPIDRVDPMSDYILGTTVQGTSHLVGSMAAFPVPGDDTIRLEARLTGKADTTGRGYNGPVRARLVGSASVQAATGITFGPDGFQVTQTQAHVSATGRPTAMWSTCKSRVANSLVTCVAKRRAAKTQELGDCIASRHAEQRLEQQLREELQTRLEPVERGYLTQFRNPLLRHDSFPRLFQVNSQAEQARVDMLLASPVQSGALSPFPAPPSSTTSDLHAQIHETAVNNLACSMLAGRMVGEYELREFMGQLFGDETAEAPVRSADQLQIVLADERPLSMQVSDSVVSVTVRASRFIRRRTRYPAMNMIVRYRVEQSEDQVLAEQSGEPEVVPRDFEEKGRRRLSAREVAARRLITTMLKRELAPSYQLTSFTLPEPADAYGELLVTHLAADNGWLDIGARRKEEARSGD